MPRTSTPAPGPLVCVVDDDPSLRRAVERLLSQAGYRTVAFGSAEDFLASNGHVDIGCLVLDVQLAGLTGFELCDRLSASGRSIPVIFITGYDSALSRQHARASGAAAYLTKPFAGDQLLDAIDRVMVSRPRQLGEQAPNMRKPPP